MVLTEGLALTAGAADPLIEQVAMLQQSGQLDAAEEALSVLAKRHPDHPRLPWLRGDLATARMDHAAAAAIYAEGLAARPCDAGLRLRLARSLRPLGRHEEALAVLAEGLALTPGAADLLIEQVALLQQSGQLEAAGESISVLARRHPDHPKLPWLRGDLATARMDHASAAASYAEALTARPRDVRLRVRLASSLRLLERHEEALAVLAEGLALTPGAADLSIGQVAMLRQSGQLDAAEEAVSVLAKRHPDHPKLPWLRGELAAARMDHAAAATIYAEGLAARPRDAGLRVRLASSLRPLGRHEEALAVLAEGLALTPGAADLSIEQVAVLQQSGQLDAAGESLSILARQHPDHPKLPWLRGDLATARMDHAAAAASYAEALTARPRDARLRVRLAGSLRPLGRHEEALAVLAEGLALTPGAADLSIGQVAMLRQSGQLDAAEDALSVLAKRHPDHPKLPWLRGDLATARMDHGAAAAIHAEALAARPRDAGLRVRLAGSLRLLERHEEALAVLAEGLALTPGATDLSIEQVAVLRQSGQLEAAGEALSVLARQHPDHPKLPWLRGDLATARMDHAAAAAIYAEALAARPRDTGLRVRLASSLRQLGRHEEALAMLAEGLALTPGAADLSIEQVAALRQSGQLEAAGATLAAIAERNPDHPKLPLLRAELADAMGDYDTGLEILKLDLLHHPGDTARRLQVSSRLQQAGLVREALALIGDPPLRTHAERVARVNVLIQLGRWDDAAKELAGWPSDTPHAATARARSEMQLAMLTFDFALAKAHAERLLAENPGDARTAQTLVAASMLAFDADTAWSALGKVPILPAGNGPPRLGRRRLRHSYGQLINELRLRPRETAMLATAAASSGEMQARRAAVLLRRNPDSVGAAIALLIGMARAGRFARGGAAGSLRRQIPPKLHQYWDGDPQDDVERFMSETAAVNPGCTYRRWNDAEARRYLSALHRPDLLRGYREAKHVAIRADVFRLALLLTEGGIYLDADDRCVGPIDTLLPPGAEAVFYQEPLGSIGNNFLAAAPGNPLIATALNEAIRAVLEGAGESTWLGTGPGLLSRVVAMHIAHSRTLGLPRGVHIVPQSVFRETVQAGRRARYKHGTRHWVRAAI